MRMKRNWVLPIIVFFLVGTMLSGLYLSMTQEAVAQNRKRYEYIAKNESETTLMSSWPVHTLWVH